MNKLSKGMYFGVMIGGYLVGIVLVFMGMGTAILGAASAGSAGSDSGANAAGGVAAAGGFGLAMLGLLCMLAAMGAYLHLVYRAWSAINDGQQRTSPVMAAVLLLIPLFNLYWMFQAIWGWAQDYNKYVARHNLTAAPKMNEQMFLFQPIALIACVIPIVNMIAGLAHLVLLFINASSMIDGTNFILGGGAPAPMAAAAGQ